MTLFKTLFTTLQEGHSTVSVTDSVITSDSIFEIYTDNNTVVMESVAVTDTTALITFDSNATEDIAVAVWINNLNGSYEPFSGNYNDLTNRPTIPVIEVDPILTEGEPIADISINGTNYEIYAPEGETVIANPTLTGEEAVLEGLQVGDNKYKIVSNDIYSETEVIIGMYKDKPLYRKIFHTSETIHCTANTWVDSGITINNVKLKNGFISTDTSNGKWALNMAISNQTSVLRFKLFSDGDVLTNYDIIVEYIKTTD